MDLYSEGMYRLPYRKLYRWEVLSYVHHTEKTGGSRTGDYAGHLEQRWAGYFEFYFKGITGKKKVAAFYPDDFSYASFR